MELIEIGRSHLRVDDGSRSNTIYGEALLRGYGSPDFVLYENGIEKWDPPNEQKDVTSRDKEQLLRFVQEEFIKRKMVLEID